MTEETHSPHSHSNDGHDHATAQPATQAAHRDHSGEHEHDDHDHEAASGPLGWLKGLFHSHSHSTQQAAMDPALATDAGIRTLKISLFALLLTAGFQSVIVAISGSAALLADTIHNFSDALTAIPLGLAFWLSRRSRDRRFTYGFGRAEDIAGAIIVVMIFITAVQAIYQSARKLIDPQPVENLGWVAAAAVIGFIGNEAVALYRIRTGKQINSAALVADGLHARTDGFTSLAVLAGAIGVWLGFPLLDPLVGLGIGLAILVIVWSAGKEIWMRILDAVDPEITRQVEQTAAGVDGVLDVHQVAVRWMGHRLWAELHLTVDCQLPTYASHQIVEDARHALFHALPTLAEITVHADPCECERLKDAHRVTEEHMARNETNARATGGDEEQSADFADRRR